MALNNEQLPQKLDLRNVRVHELLGESGCASFWRTSLNGHEVVLKVLNSKTKSAPARPGTVTRADGISKLSPEADLNRKIFLREAEIMQQIEHRNILRCYGVSQLPGGFVPNQTAPALVMAVEVCGQPQTIKQLILRSMATGGRRVYKLIEAYKWLVQISSALAYLHGRKPAIIHRDIKADNVLLKRSRDGGIIGCKLSGFGPHAVLYEDRSNALRRRAFTQTHVNPLADTMPYCGGGGADVDVSQSARSMYEISPIRLAASKSEPSSVEGRKPLENRTTTDNEERPSTEILGRASTIGFQAAMHDGSSKGSAATSAEQNGSVGKWAASVSCLGTMDSLLRQLDISELQPLRTDEVEKFYALPEKAESFMYMAPEVFNNLPCTERSDVFSFGVLAYELLAGEALSFSIFNTARASRLNVYNPQGYAAKVADGYRPARLLAIPDSAWALIAACWHQDPVQRPSMDQVQAELQRMMMELVNSCSGGSGSSKTLSSAKGAKPSTSSCEYIDVPAPTCAQQCAIC